ncbi:MAG: 2-C-methyl-D-erythritol 4-phosphate cytidylyltransferase [Eubacteriales bacterium]|nr:2-C-methyl-D-erythritol 4-phosphate cytidylyltransferase [Eubacteriales bacterium]
MGENKMGIADLFRKTKTPPVCSAVVVAAGASRRMGEDKTLMLLGGKPVLIRTLSAFEQCDSVEEIVVVTQRDRIVEIADLCKKYSLSKVSKVIAGGATRSESSLAGASEVKSDARLIAIHDGARPFITPELITATVNAASEHMAAAPALRSTDTLKAVDDKGFIIGTVDRETTVRIQTPQVFSAELIKGGLTKAVTGNIAITDDCLAMEMMGVKVFTVEGDESNIKLTTPKDVILAEAILADRGEKI